MSGATEFPKDFQECLRFHGHLCPGVAIGYAAVKAGRTVLDLGTSEDEEIVAIVENDSCAVDAIQVLLGCTFGKGNLIFRDWGKMVFTFFDRNAGTGVRVSLSAKDSPTREQRRGLKAKIDAGNATESEKQEYETLRTEEIKRLVAGDPRESFDITQVRTEMPPTASIVGTKPCEQCGEATMTSRLNELEGRFICSQCMLDHS